MKTLKIEEFSRLVKEHANLQLATVSDKEIAYSASMTIIGHIDRQIKESMEALRLQSPETENTENVIKVDFVSKKRI